MSGAGYLPPEELTRLSKHWQETSERIRKGRRGDGDPTDDGDEWRCMFARCSAGRPLLTPTTTISIYWHERERHLDGQPGERHRAVDFCSWVCLLRWIAGRGMFSLPIGAVLPERDRERWPLPRNRKGRPR